VSIYTTSAATVDRLFGASRFGQSIVLNRYTDVVDLVTGEVVSTVSATATVNGIVLPASAGTIEAFDNRLANGTLVDKTLRFVKLSPVGGFEPLPHDELVFGGRSWEVLGCTPVNPAGTPVVYGLGVVAK
jgi:hypothetical protein